MKLKNILYYISTLSVSMCSIHSLHMINIILSFLLLSSSSLLSLAAFIFYYCCMIGSGSHQYHFVAKIIIKVEREISCIRLTQLINNHFLIIIVVFALNSTAIMIIVHQSKIKSESNFDMMHIHFSSRWTFHFFINQLVDQPFVSFSWFMFRPTTITFSLFIASRHSIILLTVTLQLIISMLWQSIKKTLNNYHCNSNWVLRKNVF